jgi:hypothetical protein
MKHFVGMGRWAAHPEPQRAAGAAGASLGLLYWLGGDFARFS